MKLDQLEHYDTFFGGEYVFWLEISGLPEHIQDQARGIAGDDYDPKCFGVCAGYDPKADEFYLVTDTGEAGEARTVYYIDLDGDKHWFSCEIPPEFQKQIFAECDKAIAKERAAQKPSVRNALKEAEKEAAAHPISPAKKSKDKGPR